MSRRVIHEIHTKDGGLPMIATEKYSNQRESWVKQSKTGGNGADQQNSKAYADSKTTEVQNRQREEEKNARIIRTARKAAAVDAAYAAVVGEGNTSTRPQIATDAWRSPAENVVNRKPLGTIPATVNFTRRGRINMRPWHCGGI